MAKKKKTDPQISQIDAACIVLQESDEKSMSCGDMVKQMAEDGLWESTGGKTPASTLASAILREITKKGDESRFVKIDRGQFGLTKVGKKWKSPELAEAS